MNCYTVTALELNYMKNVLLKPRCKTSTEVDRLADESNTV